MHFQLRESWCAPACVQNALERYGSRVGQKRIATLMGDEHGTRGSDAPDILWALDFLKVPYRVYEGYHKGAARSWLTRSAGVWPLILCVDDFDHWVLVAGGVGDRLYLFDSDTDVPSNVRAMGQHTLRPKTIVRRWRASRDSADNEAPYYAIAVLGPPAKR